MLRQHYGASPHWPALAQALDPVLDAFATGRTATVAETSTRVLLDLLGWRGKILTSSSLPARPGRSSGSPTSPPRPAPACTCAGPAA